MMKFMDTDDVSLDHEDDDDDEDEDDHFLDDDSTGSESLTGSVNVAREDIRLMNVVRAIIILVLLTLAFILSEVAFVVSTLQNEGNFRAGYTTAATELVDRFYSEMEIKLLAAQSLATEISSSASEQSWPFVSIPDFQDRCQAPMKLAEASSIHFSPFVDAASRSAWERYAVDMYSSMTKQDPIVVGNASKTAHYLPTERTINEGIYYFKDETAFTLDDSNDSVFPIWQTAPRPAAKSSTGIQATLYGQTTPVRAQALEAMVLRGGSAVSTWLYQQTNHSDFAVYNVPEAVLSYPLRLGLSQDSLVVGALNLQFQWEQVLAGAVKDYSQSVHAVIENSCGENFTYAVQGLDADFVGEGNLAQDIDLSYTLVASSYAAFAALFDKHGDVPVDPETACNYKLMVFPSPDFQAAFHNSYPNMFRGLVLLVFFCVIIIFVVYDCVVEDRQAKVVNQAQRSDAIVRSLFPDAVRDKLYQNAIKKEEEQKLVNKSGRVETPKHKLKKMLAEDPEDGSDVRRGLGTDPIADLFPSASVLFADIVGFTAWSSEREPTQVFILLETIYRSMDRTAKKLGVFKVETIGDCYVAATGVPEAQTDHAERLCHFARLCLIKVNHLTKMLEKSLGPGTGDLGFRVGINSGQVTGGVLRGQKARFQLFGNTMNFAARMESNGAKNKVHLSADTAKLLIAAGLSHRVTQRADLVDCKGKGLVQTYWLELGSSSDSHGTSYESSIQSGTSNETPIDANPDIDELDAHHHLKDIWANTGLNAVLGKTEIDAKLERLVFWATDVLLTSLKGVVALREAQVLESSPMNEDTELFHAGSGFCLDELATIVPMPYLDKNAVERADPSSVHFSDEVRLEARDYVAAIVSGYRRNTFHSSDHCCHTLLSAVKLIKRIATSDTTCQSLNFTLEHDVLLQFAALFSCLIHDVGHKGVGNGRLAIEEPEVAAKYRNKSLAEQRSLDVAWQLLMLPHFKNLRRCIYTTTEEKQRFRSLVVHSILATDIFDKDLKQQRDDRWDLVFHSATALTDSKEHFDRKAMIVLEHIIQASDVSHTMQHWHIYQKWNERLFAEMYFAFLKGRADKDPSEGWYYAELFFFDTYVIPLAKKLKECGVFGVSSDEYLNYAVQNRNEWEMKGKECVQAFLAKCTRDACRRGLPKPPSTEFITPKNEQKEFESQTTIEAQGSGARLAPPMGESSIFTAPPGRLGITIDTSKGYPVIFEVARMSPIAKFVRPGDHIIDIDGVRVTEMSTAAISALMSAKQQQHRNFVVRRHAM